MSCKNCDSCGKDKDITFHNVRITLSAKDAKIAYAELVAVLSMAGIEYETDTYSSNCDDEEHSTEELFDV